MAFNISGLANNIEGTISNFVDQLLGGSSSKGGYPTNESLSPIQNEIESIRSHWNHLPAPYTFEVIDIVDGSSFAGWSPFQLPLAPNSLEQEETPAIAIKATQGGTVVSHSGMRYKDLSFSGTTGLAPFRGFGGVLKSTGEAIGQPSQMKFKSGFEVFIELRNYLKTYYQFKKNQGEIARDARLVWKNFKDGEFLVVELKKFKTSRKAERAFLYDYDIEFKVLQHFTFKKGKDPSDFLSKLDEVGNAILEKLDLARGIMLRSQDLLRQVESTYESTVLEPMRKTTLAIKATLGVGTVAADMSKKLINNTVSTTSALAIIVGLKDTEDLTKNDPGGSALSGFSTPLPDDPAAAVAAQGAGALTALNDTLLGVDASEFPETALDALAVEQEDALNLQRSFYTDAIADLRRVKANAEDKFNLGSTFYDDLFNRTSTVTAESGKTVTDEEFELLQAFNEAITALRLLLSSNNLFKSPYSDRIADMNAQFNGELGLKALPAVKQMPLPTKTDLEELAQNELGDPTRWVEIAELNDLRAPYVIQDISDTTSNVKRPGETILIPQALVSGFSSAPQTKEIPSTIGLSELEKSLGTDLKITNNFDLALGNNGDLQVVSGAENMGQAIALKLGYEKKELRNNPEIGVGIGVGRKFPLLFEIRQSLVSTMTQDSRIEKIFGISIKRNGGELLMHFNIKIKQIDVPVPVVIKIQ